MKSFIKNAIGKVIAGEEPDVSIGTAFIVADGYALTALHVIGNRELILNGDVSFFEPIKIVIEGMSSPVSATVEGGQWDADNDWALLKLNETPKDVLPISLGILPDGAIPPFEAFGYPIEHGSLTINGNVRDANAKYFESSVLQLSCEQLSAGGSPLNGLSGAPCLVGSYVIGVIRAHPVKRTVIGTTPIITVKNGVLYACPLTQLNSRCKEFIPAPVQLTHEAIQRTIAPEDRLASLRHYQTALHRFSSTLPYRLPSGQNIDIGSVYVNLPATIKKKNNKEPGTATDLMAEGLKTNKKVVVTGPPGAGKTSLFHFLSQVLWEQPERAGFDKRRLVILCRLRDLARVTGVSVGERIRNAIGTLPEFAMGGTGISDDFLDSWPEQTGSKLLFLFDAFDEVPQHAREDLVIWFKALLQVYPDAEYVISSRDEGLLDNTPFDSKPGGAAWISLDPPTIDQAISVASAWVPEETTSFIERLKQTGIGDTLLTPLGIALSASVYAAEGLLPEFRADLYSRYVDIALINAQKQGAKDQTQLEITHLRYLLQRVAWHATEIGQLSQTDILHEVQVGLREIKPTLSVLDAEAQSNVLCRILKERSGILVSYTEWKHETFREFLAAEYLNRDIKPDDAQAIEFMKQHADPRWKGVLLFLFSLWSVRAQKCNEEELEIYRNVFVEMIGKGDHVKTSDAKGSLLDLAKKLLSFSTVIPAKIEESSILVPEQDAVLFASEALLELGAAPIDVENKILTLLFKKKRDIGRKVINSCAAIYSDEGVKERNILRLWPFRARLNQRLDPWVNAWMQDLTLGKDDVGTALGFLLLCQRAKKIEDFIQKSPVELKTYVALLGGLNNSNIYKYTTEEFILRCQRLIVRKLLDSFLDSRRTPNFDITDLDITEIRDAVFDPSKFLANHLSAISNSHFLRRFDAYVSLAQIQPFKHNQDDSASEIMHYFMVCDKPGSLAVTVIGFLIQAFRKIQSPLIATTIESFELEAPGRIIDDENVPASIRRFIRWYLSSRHTKDNFFKKLEMWFLEISQNAEKVTKLILDGLALVPVPIMIEELQGHNCDEIFIPLIVEILVQRGMLANVADIGFNKKIERNKRILALEALVEKDYSIDCKPELLSIYNDCLAEEPNNIEIIKARAELWEKLDKYEEAERDWDAIIGHSPTNVYALGSRAWIRYYRDYNDAALEDIECVLQNSNQLTENKLGNLWFLKGMILYHKNRFSDAIACYDQAEALGILRYRLHQNRASSYYCIGLLEEAINDVEMVLEDDDPYVEDQSLKDLFVDARMLKALCLSSLGKWEDSDALIMGREGELDKKDYWITTRMQNLLGLGGFEKAQEFLATLGSGYELSPWEETMAMFVDKALSGELSKVRVQQMQASIVECKDPIFEPAYQFWLFVATGDAESSKKHIEHLIESKREAALRWIVLDAKITLKPFLPAWASALITQADDAIARIKKQLKQDTNISRWVAEGTIPVSLESVVEVKRSERKKKYLFSQGMLCQLHAISTYDEELDLGKQILKPYENYRSIVMIPLLDTGHIYIQANCKWDADADFNFKMVAEYSKLRDQGILEQIIVDHNIQKVIVTDKNLYGQIGIHPALRSVRNRLVFEPYSLPYTKEDVMWETV